MMNYHQIPSNQKLEQFVNRYEEEFGSKVLIPQLLANIFSPSKRNKIILENVISERIYTSEIDNFTLEQIQDLENYLTNKIQKTKRERNKWFVQNLAYTMLIGIICGIFASFSKLNLLWILPLFIIYIIIFFKKNKNWIDKITNYMMLIYWITVYKLRKNNQ